MCLYKTHADAHTDVHGRRHAQACARSESSTNTHTHTHKHAHIHNHLHTGARARVLTHTHAGARARAQTIVSELTPLAPKLVDYPTCHMATIAELNNLRFKGQPAP